MKVTVNQPNLASGVEVEVLHFGVFKNGTTTTFTDVEGPDVLIGDPLEEKQVPGETEEERVRRTAAEAELVRIAAEEAARNQSRGA